MKRFLLVPMVGIIAALGLGSAAALGGVTGLTTPDIAAADALVASCDTDGVSIQYTTTFDSGYTVTHVVVSDIALACNGDQISVVLTNAGVPISDGFAVIGGVSANIDVANVLVENVTDVHVMIDDN